MLNKNCFAIIHIITSLPYLTICSMYDFATIENVKITKARFIKEQHLVMSLKNMRNRLFCQICDMYWHYNVKFEMTKKDYARLIKVKSRNMVAVQVINHFCHSEFNKDLTYSLLPQYLRNLHHVPEISTIDHTLSAKHIIKECLSGIMFLHETYDLNIEEFSKGKLYLKNEIDNSRKTDKLQPDDLALASTIAFNNHWYSTGLKYLSESIIIVFNQHHTTEHNRYPSSFQNKMLNMKRGYSKYHTATLTKNNDTLEHQWKLRPYIVEEGL